MSHNDLNNGWSFYDWFILIFMVLMVAGLLSALFGPALPVEPGWLER